MLSCETSKFRLDVLFSYGSLALLASSGIIINYVLAQVYGSSVLGKFNLVYALYIVISQFSALGVHYAVLRDISLKENQRIENIRKIITSAMILVFFIGTCTGFLVKLLAPVLHFFYDDAFVINGVLGFTYVLPLFAMNKVMLAAFNGMRQMRLFALGQSCRYLLMLSYICLVAFLKLDFSNLINVFYFSEQCLFLILAPIVFFVTLGKKICFSTYWLIHHFKFGKDAFLAGVFIEINSRIDVIILAAFVSSSLVGIYSFAAMIAEGFAMMLVVLRSNVNPIMSTLLHDKKYDELCEFMLHIRKYTYITMTMVMVLTFVAYIYITNHYLYDLTLSGSWLVLLIISSCLLLVSGYLPFSDFLILANKPRLQSFQNLLVVISNILLNFLLTPTLGIVGAAISAGVSSYIISILLIEWLAKSERLNFLNLRKLKLGYAV
jgi:O-antigen/teichoic acid export membrane protein